MGGTPGGSANTTPQSPSAAMEGQQNARMLQWFSNKGFDPFNDVTGGDLPDQRGARDNAQLGEQLRRDLTKQSPINIQALKSLLK